jgi:hypothetical protein
MLALKAFDGWRYRRHRSPARGEAVLSFNRRGQPHGEQLRWRWDGHRAVDPLHHQQFGNLSQR